MILLDQAIARDPRFGLALTLAGTARVTLDVQGAADDPAGNRAEAVNLAHRSIEAAPDDAQALCGAGHVLGYFCEDIEAAIVLVERGLSFNPSYAQGWIRNGLLRLYRGDVSLAIDHIETAMRLDPRARMGWPLTLLGIAYFFDRRFDLAVAKLLAAIQEFPSYLTPYRFLIACYAHQGRLTEAREISATLNSAGTVLEPNIAIWRRPERRQLILSGLSLATGKSG